MEKSAQLRVEQLISEIHSEWIKEKARNKKDVSRWTRQRKMPLSDILTCTLAKKGLSTVMEVRQYFQEAEKVEQTVSKQNYLRQRQKLNPQVFTVLSQNYLKRFYEGDEAKCWCGYLVLAVDGSRAEVPDSIENRLTYGENGNQYGKTVTRANISALYDVENQFILDLGIHRCGSSERADAEAHMCALKEIVGERKALIILDRGYASLEFINYLEQSGVKYLIRLQAGTYKAEVSKLQGRDEWVTLEHTARRLSNMTSISVERKQALVEQKYTAVRMVRTAFSDEEQGILITNLKEGSAETILQLYRRRWKLEQKYHTLKNKMKFESVTGKASIYVEQDFWAQMLVFNIVQDLITSAERGAARRSRKKNHRHEIRINENIAIGLFKEQIIKVMVAEEERKRDALLKRLIADMERYIVPVRKLKSSPRKWKRANKYKCNQKPSF